MRYNNGFNISFGEGHSNSKTEKINKKIVIKSDKKRDNRKSQNEITEEKTFANETINSNMLTDKTVSIADVSHKNEIITTTKTKTKSTIISKLKPKEIKKQHKQDNQKENKKAASVSEGAGKSWLVAFILCFFLGGFGLHRFYLGYTGIGIIQLLTLGGFGLWWLIDFFRLLIGSLKPKNGDYNE